MNWKQVKSIKIKEGDVKSLSINGRVVWSKGEVPPEPPVEDHRFRFYNPGDQVNTLSNSGSPSFETSTDGVNWTPDAVFTSMDIQPKSMLYLRGSNESLRSVHFNSTSPIECHGDIANLVKGYTNGVEWQFFETFLNMSTLLTVPSLKGFSRASRWQFDSMFKNCTGLTEIPEDLFDAMDCKHSSFGHTFDGCINLKNSPAIKFKTLEGNYTFNHFLYGCSSLNKVTVTNKTWPNDTLDFEEWLTGVPSNGTFIKPTNTEINYGPQGIPESWDVVDDTFQHKFRFYNPGDEPNTVSLNKIYENKDLTQLDAPDITLSKSYDGIYYEPCNIYEGITLQPKQSVYLRGNNTEFYRSKTITEGWVSKDLKAYNSFRSTKPISCMGRLTDIIDNGTNTNKCKVVGQFRRLFMDMTTLLSCPEIPNSGLTNLAFDETFRGCTSITSTPEIEFNDTNTAEVSNICHGMFEKCYNLTDIRCKFYGGGDSAFSYMFTDCTSLTNIPVIRAKHLGTWCCFNMYQGCTNIQGDVKIYCDEPTVAPYPSFDRMFAGCTKLNHVTFIGNKFGRQYEWLLGCAPKGTVVVGNNIKPWSGDIKDIPNNAIQLNSPDGVPEGWNLR